MAVYKATYCYPFLNTFDPRIVATKTNKSPAQYLKCKVDTSNKTVTGYQIIIRDNKNNIVFPVDKDQNNWKISPIQELEQDLDVNGYINSGINGSYLNIAFIQNLYNNTDINPNVDTHIYKSFNAVYFTGAYVAQYIISPTDPSITEDPAGDINNWSYQAGADGDTRKDTLTLNINGWDSTLNGDLISEGDIVFVKSDDSDKGGLWTVYSGNQLRRYRDYDGTFIDASVLADINIKPKIFITQGNAPRENGKHYYYYYDNSQDTPQFVRFINQDSTDSNKKLWVSGADNSKIVDLTIQGGSYKWEVILYQGEGKIYKVTEDGDEEFSGELDSFNNLYYIKYDEMSYENYDMTLTSGQILGSTLTRFQLANKATDELVDNSGNLVGLLPGEKNTSPLVLLNKYAQLLDIQGNPSLSNRIVVNSYDATYGHVYFKEGAVTEDIFDNTSKVEFYKYSNVIEDILEGDIVDVATSETVNIADHKITLTLFNDGGQGKIDGVTVTQGMRVLIKNANDARYNGIYIAETGTVDGQPVAWSRAGSFNTWGSFIGKILCVRSGSQNRGKNFQSQAKIGGTLLIPDGTAQADGSYLYFNEEQPIVLFNDIPGQKIYQTDLYSDSRFSTMNSTTIIDGYPLSVNMKICAVNNSYQRQICTIKQITSSGITWDNETNVSNTDYIKVSLGQYYGNKIVRSGEFSKDLSSVYVLKNTTNYTFISPFAGIDKNNAIFFYNKDKINYDITQTGHPETPSYWIKIKDLYEKFWLIKHAKLENSLNSMDPYKYEVRSFFRASDENPFFTYENPYLRLKPNESFNITSTQGSFEIETNGRFVTLQGYYYQPQQASWETYRWILRNNDGDIIQDTGKKYDKNLLTTFYGLTKEEGKNIYFATLYVEDSLNNSLELTIKMRVNTEVEEFGIPFEADFDCDTHSVKLYYQDIPFVKPTVVDSIYSEVYAEDNKNKLKTVANVDWDYSVIYNNIDNTLNIKGKNESDGAEWGDNDLHEYSGSKDNIQFKSKVSNSVVTTYYDSSFTADKGINYRHYFAENDLEVENDQKRLVLHSTGSEKDEFAFKTDLILDTNYCGQILKLKMDGTETAFSPQQNKLLFVLSMPDNFKKLDLQQEIYEREFVADDRNCIQFDILTQDSEDDNEISKFNSKQYLYESQPPAQATDLIEGGTYHIHIPAHTKNVFKSEYICFCYIRGTISNIKTQIQPYDRGSTGDYNSCFGCSNGAPVCYGVMDGSNPLSQLCYQLDDADYDFDADLQFSSYVDKEKVEEYLLQFIDTRFKTFNIENSQYYYLQFNNSTCEEDNPEFLHYKYLNINGQQPSQKLKIYFFKDSVGEGVIPCGVCERYSSNCLVEQGFDSVLNYWVEYQNHETYKGDRMLNTYTGVYNDDSTEPYWPSELEEQGLYWKEGDFNNLIAGQETELENSRYNESYNSYGYKQLVSWKRHPYWSDNHYRIELIAKDIKALYEEDGDNLTVVAGSQDDKGYYITNVMKDEEILLIIKIKRITEEE